MITLKVDHKSINTRLNEAVTNPITKRGEETEPVFDRKVNLGPRVWEQIIRQHPEFLEMLCFSKEDGDDGVILVDAESSLFSYIPPKLKETIVSRM